MYDESKVRQRIADYHQREARKARVRIRTEAAIAAMQALIQAGHRDPVRAADEAFRYADAFIERLGD